MTRPRVAREGAPRRWQRLPDDRPRVLMASALKLVKRHGYRRVRLEDIADDAGVSKATVYHYFANKDDLLTRSVASRMAERQEGHRAAAGGAGRQRRRSSRVVSRRLLGDIADLAIRAVAASGHRARCRPRRRDVFAAWARGLVQRWRFVERLIKEGQTTGEFRRSADAAVAVPVHPFRADASGALPRAPRHAAVRTVRRSTGSSTRAWISCSTGCVPPRSRHRDGNAHVISPDALLVVRAPRSAAVSMPAASGAGGAAAAAAAEVSVITVAPERVALTSEWIATLDGYVNAQIRPQVTGYLLKRNYDEGRGRPQGPGAVRDRSAAVRVGAGAGAGAARRGRRRSSARPSAIWQRDRRSPSSARLRRASSTTTSRRTSRAQAAVKSATAAVETAQLNVGFTKVTSLIDGVAAIATAQIGDLVGPATLLTTVSQIDPIKAYFPLERAGVSRRWPAGSTAAARKAPWAGGGGADADPRRRQRLPAHRHVPRRRSRDRREDRHDPHQRDVPQSRSDAAARAVRPRPRRDAACATDALLVPQRAVTELQGSFQVRVVGADNKVSTRTVTVGDRVGSRWIVDRGTRSRRARRRRRRADAATAPSCTPTPFAAAAEAR